MSNFCVCVYFEAGQHQLQTEGQNVFASAGNKPQIIAYKQEMVLIPHPTHFIVFCIQNAVSVKLSQKAQPEYIHLI